ncbi:MAG: hypothetical protein WC284_08175 [Candidimonas sp.]
MRLDEIDSTILSKAVLSSRIKYDLYHISHGKIEPGIWKPQISKSQIVDNVPKISVAPTITNCYWAVYSKYAKEFEEKHKSYLTFYVYQPIFSGNEKVLLPNALTSMKLAPAAHVTHEHWIINSTMMKLLYKIKIFNTNMSPELTYRPFGKGQMTFLSPLEVSFKVIDDYTTTEN